MQRILVVFFTALGVILGGSLLGSLGATLTKNAPFKLMNKLAQDIKLWAVVTAIGGTFSNLKAIEGGVFKGRFLVILKQFILLTVSFLGAQLGIWLISILTGSN